MGLTLEGRDGARRGPLRQRLSVPTRPGPPPPGAFALDGPRHHRDRTARAAPGAPERPHHLAHVVAVDGDGPPAEGLEPLPVRLDVVLEHRRLRLAEAIDIDDRDQIVEAVVAGDRR